MEPRSREEWIAKLRGPLTLLGGPLDGYVLEKPPQGGFRIEIPLTESVWSPTCQIHSYDRVTGKWLGLVREVEY